MTGDPQHGRLRLELTADGASARGECPTVFSRPNANSYSVVATVPVDEDDRTTAEGHDFEISVAVTWTRRPDGGADDLGIAGTALVYERERDHTSRFEVEQHHDVDQRDPHADPAAGIHPRKGRMTSTTDDERPADRERHTFGRLAERVQSIAASARSRVDDVRSERSRRSLYADLGEIYYRAVSSGREAPDASECDPVVDSIRALETTAATDEDLDPR